MINSKIAISDCRAFHILLFLILFVPFLCSVSTYSCKHFSYSRIYCFFAKIGGFFQYVFYFTTALFIPLRFRGSIVLCLWTFMLGRRFTLLTLLYFGYKTLPFSSCTLSGTALFLFLRLTPKILLTRNPIIGAVIAPKKTFPRFLWFLLRCQIPARMYCFLILQDYLLLL